MTNQISFKTKILASLCTIVLISVCIPIYIVFHGVKQQLIEEAENHAMNQIQLVKWLMINQNAISDLNQLDAWCKAISQKLHYRITFIAEGGQVVADSDVPFSDIKSLDNHANREEIRNARLVDIATSIRYSRTIGRNLIYAASQIDWSILPGGIVRLAIPLSKIEVRFDHYIQKLWIWFTLSFLGLICLSYVIARHLEIPMKEIMEIADSIAKGKYSNRLSIDSSRELSTLSKCINHMADRIQDNVNTISEQKRELEAILQGMKEGVMLIDHQGRIKAINRAIEDIAVCQLPCIGHRPMEVFFISEFQSACDEVLTNKQQTSLDVNISNSTFYHINLVRIVDGGAVAVFHNVSEIKKLERIRQDFVANVSHELRTPLTSIKGYAETLQDDNSLSNQAQNFVSIINKNANYMVRIVENLLELTYLQSSKKNMTISEVHALTCFQSAWESCQQAAHQKNILLKNSIQEDVMIQGNSLALIQIFRNLLDNAIRYSQSNSVIKVFNTQENNQIIFGIQDQGQGIPIQHQERIFERFYRVDKERSRASGGTGLGLSICRHAVLKMGGKIWVKSPPEDQPNGTVFFFCLKSAMISD